MSAEEILEALADLAAEHEQMVADEFMGRPCIRCQACQKIVWRAPSP